VELTHERMSEEVKEGLITVFRETDDIIQSTIDIITLTLTRTIKDSIKVGISPAAVVNDVVRGVVHGAAEGGADLECTAQGIMIGVLRGAQVKKEKIIDTITDTSHVVTRDTAEFGGDLRAVASGLVEGAVKVATEQDVNAEEAAAAAAIGSLKAAGRMGAIAKNVTREAVTMAMRKARDMRRKI